MRPSLLENFDIICPKCRIFDPENPFNSPLKLHQTFTWQTEFLIEGTLKCTNPDCGTIFQIKNGIPLIIPAETSNQSYRHHIDGIKGAYINFHYDDSNTPHLDKKQKKLYWKKLKSPIQLDKNSLFQRSLDLGCGVGRFTFELARTSKIAIGLDSNFEYLSFAAELQRNGKATYPYKKDSAHFDNRTIEFDGLSNTIFILADALNPPFLAGIFNLVAGVNLLDSVSDPLNMLGQMDALLQSSGELLLCTPYEWRPDICDPKNWLLSQNLSSDEFIKKLLQGKMSEDFPFLYQIKEEISELPWVLRNHKRYFSTFINHLIVGIKQN